ncbi:MAG: hypothetical protein L0154_13460, partial [Chloroflexi bacterium]|nr:hypothetical protein [Chloroflexota bacterium]
MIEFVSNLSPDNCVRRLENQSEGFSIFSFRWQTRLVVKVRPVDQFTYNFTLKRVGKSSLWSWGGVSRVEGFLKAQTPNATVVIAQAYYNWFTIMFSW